MCYSVGIEHHIHGSCGMQRVDADSGDIDAPVSGQPKNFMTRRVVACCTEHGGWVAHLVGLYGKIEGSPPGLGPRSEPVPEDFSQTNNRAEGFGFIHARIVYRAAVSISWACSGD